MGVKKTQIKDRVFSLAEQKDASANGDTQTTPESLRHAWALDKFRIRWTRAIDSEVGFWRRRLSFDPEINDKVLSMERLHRWLEVG